MSLERFALRSPWIVFVGALIVTVLGLRAFVLMPTDYFPDTSPPQVAVITVQPGGSAADVARRITEVVEKEISSVVGLKKLSSTSRDEVSSINVEFHYEKQIGEAVVDVQNAISRIRADLPEDILEPRIYRITDATRPVLTLALRPVEGSPLSLAQVRLLAENDIKDYLLNLPGVADVDTFGGHRLEVRVRLDRDRLRAFQLTSREVAAAVKAQNITTPAGLMPGPDREALVKTVGEFKDIVDIEQTVQRRSEGAYIRLADVARVELGVQELRSLYHGNGKPAVAVNVLRADGGNTIQVIRSVKEALPRMGALWPEIEMSVTNDQQPIIERNTSGMRTSLYSSIGLTVIIIFLFLADLRSSFIALVSIPLSFLFSLAGLGFTGYTLNVVTLSGLILATGMVVDATVVVVENINRHWTMGGGDPGESAAAAVGEITTSITAGMLTTITMLIPIMFAGGYVEKVMRQFTLTLTLAMVGSLLVAVLVVPTIAGKLLRRPGDGHRLERAAAPFGRVVEALAEMYVGLLRIALRHRALTLLIPMAALVLTAALVTPIIGRELMPPMDTGIANIVFELPPSARIEDVERSLSEVERIVQEEPSVLMISSVVGSEPGEISFGGGAQSAQKVFMVVNLKTRDQRNRTIWEIVDGWRAGMNQLPGLRSLQVYEYGASPMSTSRAPIDLVLKGRDSAVLHRLAADIEENFAGMRGLVDFTPSWWLDKQEIEVQVDPRVARLYDIDPAAMADQLRLAVGGSPVSRLRLRGFLDVPIRLTYEDHWVATPERLAELDIATPRGVVPLRTLARLEERRSQTAITRENLNNTLDLMGYNRTRRISQVLAEIDARMKGVAFPGGYDFEISGTAAEMKDSMTRVMKSMMLGGILLVVLLMGTFQSFLLPVPILVAIPLAVTGSLWALLVFGQPMCMPAMMGMLLLAGIVINNSIFLIDFIKQARARGMPREDALAEAVRLRLRPVLMTTVSTFVGMLPIIMETAIGLERMSPLATAAGFGLLVGTFMTMVVTPVVYSLLDDGRAAWQNRWRGADG